MHTPMMLLQAIAIAPVRIRETRTMVDLPVNPGPNLKAIPSNWKVGFTAPAFYHFLRRWQKLTCHHGIDTMGITVNLKVQKLRGYSEEAIPD